LSLDFDRRLEDVQQQSNLSELWTVWPDVNVSEKMKCADGVAVTLSHSHQVARLNDLAVEKLQEVLENAKQTASKV